jgi:hypothetical protein
MLCEVEQLQQEAARRRRNLTMTIAAPSAGQDHRLKLEGVGGAPFCSGKKGSACHHFKSELNFLGKFVFSGAQHSVFSICMHAFAQLVSVRVPSSSAPSPASALVAVPLSHIEEVSSLFDVKHY